MAASDVAKIKTKSSFVGVGCFVQLLGLLLLLVFPVGTVIGIILLIAGSRMSLKHVCSECGNRIEDKKVKLCPVCHERFA